MPIEFRIKVVKVGNSLRVTIPKEITQALDIREGGLVGISMTDHKVLLRKVE